MIFTWIPRHTPGRMAAIVLAPALLVAVVGVVVADGHLGAALLGGLGPDLVFLGAGGAELAKGQIHPRAVPAYNVLHHIAGPLATLTLGVTGVLAEAWLVCGLAWVLHVTADRAFGFGLHRRDGFGS